MTRWHRIPSPDARRVPPVRWGVRRVAALAVFLMALAAAPAALFADQTDPRLDRLFESLGQAEDPALARITEQLIWSVWFAYPQDPDIERRMRAAQGAMAEEDFETAEALLDTIVADAPDYAEGWNRRATLRYRIGDFQGSMADIAQVLTLEPRHFGALSGMGLILLQRGDLEQAIAAYRAALEVNPTLPAARAHIAYLEEQLAGERL